MVKNESIRELMKLAMVISLFLSIVFIALGLVVKVPAAKYQDIVIGASNVVVLAVGLLRVRYITDNVNFGRIASQHLWIVFSLSTAVLALLFGPYFYPGSALLNYSSIALVSLIAIVALIAVVNAFAKKIPIFD